MTRRSQSDRSRERQRASPPTPVPKPCGSSDELVTKAEQTARASASSKIPSLLEPYGGVAATASVPI